jgi:hypothetical protein
MQVKSRDHFYSNDTTKSVLVTYEIECDATERSLDVEVAGPTGNAGGGCSVAPGSSEDHTFWVPAGGKLHCTSGNGNCVWKGTATRAQPLQRLRTYWAGFLRAVQAFEAWKLSLRPPQQRLLVMAYLLAVIWVNAYIVRQVFFIEYTGRMNSMHGVWIAMANLAGHDWFKPSWWPYWYNGMPFEFTYQPAVPGLTAAIAWLGGITTAHAFQIVCGIVYCFGPAALFLMLWQLTRRAGWSLIAAVAYSLSSASELLLPDTTFGLVHLRGARRMYIDFVWDDLPHQFSLGLVCLAILLLARALHDRKFSSFVWAGIAVAASILASAFGATVLVLFTGCLLVTYETKNWKRNFISAFLCGLGGYLAMCPFLPPSLIRAIRSNGTLFDHLAWTHTSAITLAGVACAGAFLWWTSRKWRPWYLRFFLLLTYLSFIITVLEEKWQLHFLPEATRYKVELELTLPLLLVFGIAILVDRLPRTARIVLALVCLWAADRQIIAQRHISKDTVRAVDITQTIEYQVAKWVEPNLPGWRVQAPGSIWPWLNTFSKVPQFTGGSFPTAPNREQMHISADLNGSKETTMQAVWYKAYGVDAVIVPGRDSPEFWQPHPLGHMWDGVFPLLWDERDTQIYAVPRPARRLVHPIPQQAVVWQEPTFTSDIAQAKAYVAAVENAAAIPAKFEWQQDSRARIHATTDDGQVLSVQVTYHPGWKATEGNRAVPIAKDGLGLMVLKPAAAGEHDIQLVYDGGWENKLCRAVSAMVFLGAIVVAWRRRNSGTRYHELVSSGDDLSE